MNLDQIISKLTSDKYGFLSLLPYFGHDFQKLKNFIHTRTSLGSQFDNELNVGLQIVDYDATPNKTWIFPDCNIINMDRFTEGVHDHISLWMNVNLDIPKEYYDVFFQWVAGYLDGENFGLKFKKNTALENMWENMDRNDVMFLVYIRSVNGEVVKPKENISFKEQDKILHPILKKFQK